MSLTCVYINYFAMDIIYCSRLYLQYNKTRNLKLDATKLNGDCISIYFSIFYFNVEICHCLLFSYLGSKCELRVNKREKKYRFSHSWNVPTNVAYYIQNVSIDSFRQPQQHYVTLVFKKRIGNPVNSMSTICQCKLTM